MGARPLRRAIQRMHRGSARRLHPRTRAPARVDAHRRPPRESRPRASRPVEIRVIEGTPVPAGVGASGATSRRSDEPRRRRRRRAVRASGEAGLALRLDPQWAVADPSREAVRLRARHRARQRLVGRARHGADAAEALLPPLRGDELRRRGRGTSSSGSSAASSRRRRPTRRTSTSSGVAPERRGRGPRPRRSTSASSTRCARTGRTSVRCVTSPGERGLGLVPRGPGLRRSSGSSRTTTGRARTGSCSSSG